MDGDVVGENDDIDSTAGNYDPRVAVTLAAGTYTVEATTYGEGVTGQFTLSIALMTVDEVPDPPPPTVECLAGLCMLTEDIIQNG